MSAAVLQGAPLEYHHAEHGLSVRIEVVPRPKEVEDGLVRAIHEMAMDEGVPFASHRPIREAIESKGGGRYGNLPYPFVIAVNNMSQFGHHDSSVVEALFGSEIIQSYRNNAGQLRMQTVRRPDGAWNGPRGPVNTRVSAVLVTGGGDPWHFNRQRFTLVRNPSARRPLTAAFDFRGDKLSIEDGRVQRVSGLSFGEIMHVGTQWPGGPGEANTES